MDSADQPVNIDIRPGKYNAAQLAAEVERSINEAYGGDKGLQIITEMMTTKSNIDLSGVKCGWLDIFSRRCNYS